MSKNQFYERLNAIDREGNHAFDALNALNIPFSIRKALPGSVEVEGDTLIIGEERVPINDRRRVIATVKALVEKNQQQATKIEKGEAQNKKLKQERDEYKKRPSSSGAFDEYDTVLINALGALANLKSIAFNLPDAERLRKRDYTFERLAEMRLELEEALGVRAPANGGAYQLSDDEIDELGDSM
ncbi:MAG TPA: hypothetical protein VFA21_20405 [Pyrinomonadaceae bacterium]|nr:hypothetical protein [Pyrinomonadaceae bacterium]